jgi:hypothetical protein
MLKGIELTSQTWRALEQHAKQQIATLREKNDGQSLDALRTAEIRGRIAAWKDVLALGTPAPEKTADAGGY